MHPVAIFDLITVLASLAALVILIRGWKRAFQVETKTLLAGVLIFTSFYGLCLFLEWAGITRALETMEDLTGALLPMWWAFVFYALLREASERACLISEKKFKDLTETTPDWIWEVGEKGIYTYVSPKVKDLLGYDVDEVLGKSAFDFMPENEGKRVGRFFKERALKSEPFLGLENERIHKDGRSVVIETSGIPVFDEKRQFQGFRGIDRDITERKKAEEKIQESLDKWSNTFDSISDSIMILDADFRIINANRATSEVTKKSVSEIIGNNYYKLIHKTDHPPEGCPLEKAKKTKKHENAELHLPEIGIWARVSVDPVLDEKGNVAGAVHIVRDITERKKAEIELLESEEKYKSLFDFAGDAIFTMDVFGEQGTRFLECNERTLKLFGCTRRDQILGKTPADFSPPTQPDGQASDKKAMKLASAAIEGHPQVFEWAHHRLDGTPFWVEVILNRIKLKDKYLMQAVVRDITERKKAAEALKASEENYRTIFESVNDAIMIHDAETGRPININAKMEELLGYSKEEIPNAKIGNFTANESLFSQELGVERLKKAADGVPQLFEWHVKRKNGELVWVEVNLRDAIIGGQKRVLAVVRDITERKRIDEMKDNLIRDVSHSLKTPIAISRMASDVIKKGINNEDLEAIGRGQKIADDNIRRALKNVDNILGISFLDEKKKMREKGNVSLLDAIKTNLEGFKDSIREKDLKVKVDIPKKAETVFCIPNDLITLFDNLIENAVKFTKKGSISIAGELKDKTVEVKIKDSGRGIESKNIDKVFDKFYKRQAAVPGIGLGLSICKEIAERNDGEIKITSKGVGKGTTVTVNLPRASKQGG